ncbi:MAG: 1,2-phenylacetyl-CoA epoxidase subunit PaaD [Gammaproteobacteria bacterium]
MVNIDQVLQWLGEVQDPEIPVISIVDLGVVREVAWAGSACEVTLTPTYSGCPAMNAIAQAVRDKLHAHGVDEVRIVSKLAPAWSTDWISDSGKAALKEYGIAPPAGKAADTQGFKRGVPVALHVPCPHCGARRTQLVSQFGSTPCKALYQCLECREPFDYFKCH